MLTLHHIGDLRSHLDAARRGGATVGLVPTMGYLHTGHQSLVRAAAADCDEVVTTIFVNPLQFAMGEDLDSYPRDIDGDSAKAAEAGATVLFVPDESEMYPAGRNGVATSVSVAALAGAMEGASRPTHFAGVCTVVAKLFNIVGPCRSYFGEKDFQQLAIVSTMARELSFPVEVVGCPTARAADGLALSSRNAYLDDDERRVAPVLNRALRAGAELIAGGQTDADAVREAMASQIRSAPLGELDYVEVADPATLERQQRCRPGSRLFGAIRFGRARLIDNIDSADPPQVADG
ncbi:MAG: pantoate--beta-alanine ligase [Actinomycetia bacterium]|nr:pantoate--beta-alanine ligase [Actinomycetes bacterium]